jgi:hypothetical protein
MEVGSLASPFLAFFPGGCGKAADSPRPKNENCCAMTFGGDYSGLYVFSLFRSTST